MAAEVQQKKRKRTPMSQRYGRFEDIEQIRKCKETLERYLFKV